MRCVFLLALALLPLSARAQIAEFRLTAALDTLAAIAEAGDASPLYGRMACPAADDEIEPCTYQGDPDMEATGGAVLLALRQALPSDAAWLLDAITTRTRAGYALTEVQLKVRQDGDLIGQPVLLFADHATQPLLVQLGGGPSLLLPDAPAPTPRSALDLPILMTPDLAVQLPARVAFLQAASRGDLTRNEAAALIACRTETTEGFAPVPCTSEGTEEDPAERVTQVFEELAFILGDARITPAVESVVVPYEFGGFPGAQVQFALDVEGTTKRPTLFFVAHEGAYLYMLAHPDMAPLAPPVQDAQARLEDLLARLLGWARTGDAQAAAPHIVDRSDGPGQWQQTLDASNPADLAQSEDALRSMADAMGAYDRYEVTGYFAEAESEGTWHVLETEFTGQAETRTVIFAFLLIDGVFALGDID